jgi:hypothetical protein
LKAKSLLLLALLDDAANVDESALRQYLFRLYPSIDLHAERPFRLAGRTPSAQFPLDRPSADGASDIGCAI